MVQCIPALGLALALATMLDIILIHPFQLRSEFKRWSSCPPPPHPTPPRLPSVQAAGNRFQSVQNRCRHHKKKKNLFSTLPPSFIIIIVVTITASMFVCALLQFGVEEDGHLQKGDHWKGERGSKGAQ